MSSVKVKFVEFYSILFFNIKKGRLAALGVKSKKNLYMVVGGTVRLHRKLWLNAGFEHGFIVLNEEWKEQLLLRKETQNASSNPILQVSLTASFHKSTTSAR